MDYKGIFTYQQGLSRSALFIFISFLTAYLYIYFSHYWTELGHGYLIFNPKIYFIEIPLFIILGFFFFFPSIKKSLLRNTLPLIPALTLYILSDIFYHYFGRMATFSDFENVINLFSFSFSLGLGLFFVYSLIPLSLLISLFFNGHYRISQLKQSLLLRGSLFVLFILIINSQVLLSFHQNYFNYTVWAQEDTVRENGRFNSTLFYILQEKRHTKTLKNYTHSLSMNIIKILYPGRIQLKKNVHMIVLESFIDPRLIKELNLPHDFIAQTLKRYLNADHDFSHIISPIYGGGTAQAEFELLTGIKALSLVNQIEFNTMQGQPLNAFLKGLSLNTYFLNAMITPSSEFFNSKRAYQSLGFDHVSFLEDEGILKNKNNKSPIFDGDLFTHNLQYIKHYLSQPNPKPLFNYVLGMYGHLPFARNKTLRPDLIQVKHSNHKLNNITNQFYYRTQALAHYLDALMQLDPHAIIFVTSDHLPSILSKNAHYALDKYSNIALLMIDKKTIDITGKTLYQIPWLLWDHLTGNKVNRNIDAKLMEKLYFQALFETLG
jgi:hypothetical protein